jgi:TolB-like protein
MATRLRTRLGVGLLLALAAARAATAQCPDGTPPPCGRAAVPPARSIAVLSFENLTRDTSAQYLAEGLPDQIVARLGAVGRLSVVSRTVVRRLRNADALSVQQLGRALNAAYLVNGTIRAAGGRVRVNVEALRTAGGEAIWSQTFDRAADDLVGIEEAVATEVAAGVAGRLTPAERRVLRSRVTADSRAYEQFLRGNVLLSRRTTGSFRDAITAYRAATAADPDFADAYGRLAYAYAMCWAWECRDDMDSLPGLSRRAADRALDLNPGSSDAWMGRAYLLAIRYMATPHIPDDTLLAALGAFRRAVALDPRNDEAWHQYGHILSYVSDSASLDALRRALTLDPARAVTYQGLSFTYYLTGRIDRALATMDSTVALDPDSPLRYWRVLYRVSSGDTAGAVADARATPALWTGPPALAAFARDSAAIRRMEATAAQPGCAPESAVYLVWTGRPEQATQHLLPCGPSLWVRRWLRLPTLASLAGEPRIQTLRAASDSILARARWR